MIYYCNGCKRIANCFRDELMFAVVSFLTTRILDTANSRAQDPSSSLHVKFGAAAVGGQRNLLHTYQQQPLGRRRESAGDQLR